MKTSSKTLSILILGSGEIARHLVKIADALDYPVTVCANDVGQHRWPRSVAQRLHNFTDRPWALAKHTHAIIAQGHQGDAKSLAALLNHHAEHVYLVASQARSQEVVQTARPLIKNQETLDKRLSSPAGLNLGGQASNEVALSVLAEVQWRHHGLEDCYPLSNVSGKHINTPKARLAAVACSGRRS